MPATDTPSESAPVPIPGPNSLAHRSQLARLISPLRRVRPRVPYWELAAHRIPTLWSLYRGLLRNAPGENLKYRVRTMFRKNQHLTDPEAARARLLKGHEWLDVFVKARQGDEKMQAMLRQHDKRIAVKLEKDHWNQILRNELAEQETLRRRPILTGSYLRPSIYNRPLPRLKPQPEHITMMIKKRRLARERRMEKNALLNEWRDDLRRERAFEVSLLKKGDKVEKVFSNHFDDWDRPLRDLKESILETFRLDSERQNTPFPAALLKKIKAARRHKVINKTRELDRERRGEVLPRTLRRRRKGPPAHILAQMTPEQREMDKVSRSVSEVGYVGLVKRRLGWKLRNPEAGQAESGLPEDRERLDRVAAGVRAENESRRKGGEDVDEF